MITDVQITNDISSQNWLLAIKLNEKYIVLRIPYSTLMSRPENILHDVLTNLQSILDMDHGGYKLTNEDKNLITSRLVWGYVNPYKRTY